MCASSADKVEICCPLAEDLMGLGVSFPISLSLKTNHKSQNKSLASRWERNVAQGISVNIFVMNQLSNDGAIVLSSALWTPLGDFSKLTASEVDLLVAGWEKIPPASFQNHVKNLPRRLRPHWRSCASYARTLTMSALAELICDAWVENRGGPPNALSSCLAGEPDKERSPSGEGVGADSDASSHGQPTCGNFELPQRGLGTAQNTGQHLGEYAWMHKDLKASVFPFENKS